MKNCEWQIERSEGVTSVLNVGDGYGLHYCLERCRKESDV